VPGVAAFGCDRRPAAAVRRGGPIKTGVNALDRGDFAEIDETGLDEYMERLTTPAAKLSR
jgi:hypothetical protein